MKTIKITLLALLSTTYSLTTNAQNPISPMGVYIADPSARVVGNKMYIYGSLDEAPNAWCSTRYHGLYSTDLKKWTVVPDIFSTLGENDGVPYSDMTLFAPDMATRNGKYYLYYDSPDQTEGVAEADSPNGPFKNGVKIDGAMGIDPCVFIDDDGQAYYYWGQFSGKGAKLNPDMKTIDKSTIVDGLVTEKEHHFHEGSFVFKRNGIYYYVFADVSRHDKPTCLGYAMGPSPLGPFTYKGVIIDNSGCDREVWNNHGSVVEMNGKWYVLYHRSTNLSKYYRKACIEEIHFLPDGTIPEVEMTSQGAAGPLNAFETIDAARACNVEGHTHIQMMEDRKDREDLAGMRNGDRAGWKYLDFGNGAKKITLRIKPKAGGTILVSVDEPWHDPIAVVRVKPNGDWTDVTVNLSKTINGKHALWFSFIGILDDTVKDEEAAYASFFNKMTDPKQEEFEIDSFRFQ